LGTAENSNIHPFEGGGEMAGRGNQKSSPDDQKYFQSSFTGTQGSDTEKKILTLCGWAKKIQARPK